MREIFAKRYVVLALLFMVRTIPTFFFMMALPVILRLEGYPLEAIALFQLAGVPYLLKFLWAPLLDRGGVAAGHYKRWVLWSGLVSGLLLLLLGGLNLQHHSRLMMVLVLATSVTTSNLDIAISALYIKLLPFAERGVGSSTKVLGMNLGSLLGGGFFLLVYNHFGWQACLSGIGGMVFCSLALLPLLAEKQQPYTGTDTLRWPTIFNFFRAPGMVRWSLLILLNALSSSAVFFMMKPFLVDRGVSADTIALLVGFYGTGVAAFTAIATGVQRFQRYLLQRRRAYIDSVIISALPVTLFLPISLSGDGLLFLFLAVTLLNVAISISTVVTATLVMDFSRKESASSDYALQMTSIHLGGVGMSAASGLIVAAIGYPAFFLTQTLLACLMIPASIVLFRGDWIFLSSAKVKD